jgi:hypothetical protein
MTHPSKSLLLGFVAVFVFAVAVNTAAAPTLTFKFTTIDITGASETIPGGISEAGVIAGSYWVNNSTEHCFKLIGTTVTTINYPGASSTACAHNNLNGQLIVGVYSTTKSESGFLYRTTNKTFTNIPGPKGTLIIVPTGVNDSGEIVGSYINSANKFLAFMLKGGQYTTLNCPGSEPTATGINDNGDIVLYSSALEEGKHIYKSYLYNGSTCTDISISVKVKPCAGGAQAVDINNNGDVLYDCTDSKGFVHGALKLKSGGTYTFDVMVKGVKSADTSPSGLNDHNQIVGDYQYYDCAPLQGFEATY